MKLHSFESKCPSNLPACCFHAIIHCFLLSLLFSSCVPAGYDGPVELCLAGEFDLGVRYQGLRPEAGEFSPSSWCVISEDKSSQVQFSINGRSNPDMEGQFTVSYFPPDRVRIVDRDRPLDIEFVDADIDEEAMRYRRIDPRRLVQELREHPEWIVETFEDGSMEVRYPGSTAVSVVEFRDDRLESLQTEADMPLRGRVPVEWHWEWRQEDEAEVTIFVDGDEIFQANATWRELENSEAVWELSGGQNPREVPGSVWPSQVSMQLDTLAEDVYFVRGVRTGFNHLVVDTQEGLVVGDAPAGWVELPQIPPADLVPGLGISGLSEQFIDFLGESFPGRPIRAVALTHAHDDHAGGARAFAAAGGSVYAPQEIAEFLQSALNRQEMPNDRFSDQERMLEVLPVSDRVILDDPSRTIEFIEFGANPHVSSALGLWVREPGYFFQSDIHVPNSESEEPRLDRAVTECWFAEWAVDNLPAETIVLSSHSTIQTPVSRLAKYLESEAC